MATLRLIYFDFPGRAAPIRSFLRLTGSPFVDERLSFAEFHARRAAGAFAGGRLPVLEALSADGAESQQLSSSVGEILQFLLRRSGRAEAMAAPLAARLAEGLALADQLAALAGASARFHPQQSLFPLQHQQLLLLHHQHQLHQHAHAHEQPQPHEAAAAAGAAEATQTPEEALAALQLRRQDRHARRQVLLALGRLLREVAPQLQELQAAHQRAAEPSVLDVAAAAALQCELAAETEENHRGEQSPEAELAAERAAAPDAADCWAALQEALARVRAAEEALGIAEVSGAAVASPSAFASESDPA